MYSFSPINLPFVNSRSLATESKRVEEKKFVFPFLYMQGSELICCMSSGDLAALGAKGQGSSSTVISVLVKTFLCGFPYIILI